MCIHLFLENNDAHDCKFIFILVCSSGGPYNVFAGKECARALAMMKVEATECTGVLDDLNEKQLKVLSDWEKKFTEKYGVKGEVRSAVRF